MANQEAFIEGCPACQEMRQLGLTYEETHSSHLKDFLDTEDGFVPNPHIIMKLQTRMAVIVAELDRTKRKKGKAELRRALIDEWSKLHNRLHDLTINTEERG